MKTPDSRSLRLTSVDALILGISIALGGWVWDTIPTYIEYSIGLRDHKPNVMRRLEARARPKGDTLPLTLARWRNLTLSVARTVLPFVTIGAAFVTFRRRAGRSRRALRRVGVLTTAVSAVFVAISLANEYALRRLQFLQVGHTDQEFDVIWWSLAGDLSLAIATLWAVLGLGRSWQADSHGADRLGRVIGAAWVGYCVLRKVPFV